MGDATAGEGWDFFISYTQVDRGWAEWIAWLLEEAGYRVLVQAWDMVPGSNWVDRMDRGVAAAERTVAVLSADYLSSVYGTAEWQAAWRVDPLGDQRRLIQVRVAECEWPAGLRRAVVGIDLVRLGEAAARRRLLEGIQNAVSGRRKPDQRPPFPAAARAVPSEPQFPGAMPEVHVPPPHHLTPTGREDVNTSRTTQEQTHVAKSNRLSRPQPSDHIDDRQKAGDNASQVSISGGKGHKVTVRGQGRSKGKVAIVSAISAAVVAVVTVLTYLGITVVRHRDLGPTPPVADGGSPAGCTADARRAHEQIVLSPRGQPLGTLQLMNSPHCQGMWGRFVPTSPASKEFDVTLTVVRASDNREDSYHDKVRTVPIFTGLLEDKGSCFLVRAIVGTPDGVVNVTTPCTR